MAAQATGCHQPAAKAKKVKAMNQTSLHPGVELLTRYNRGQLSAEQFAEVESHVLECDTCCGILQELPADSFIERLRAAHVREQHENDSPRHVNPHQETVSMHGDPAKCETPSSAFQQEGSQTSVGDGDIADDSAVRAALVKYDRYYVKDICGVGGMGAVYRAEHRMMGREVALKVINHEMMGRPQAVERFRIEVRAAARLSHPNIVAAYDAEQVDDLQLLIMEYVDGRNLAEEVGERGRLSVGEACDFIRQAANGLQHAYEEGMVHRDIKPQNLMLTTDGEVKILDFGLASLVTEEHEADLTIEDSDSDVKPARLTQASTTIGTPDYIAPEQIADARTADIRSDIYGLGCTLHFLLTAQPPFPRGSMAEKIKSHVERDPRPIEALRDDVPPALADVRQRMMAKDPADRYATPQEVADALQPFATPTESIESKSATQPNPPPRKRSRTRFVWIVAPLLTALLIAAGMIYVKTDTGTIAIQTDDPNVRVIVERNGEQVTILDRKTSQQATLDTGEYTLRLGGETAGFELSLPEGEPFHLKRGERRVVTIRRVAKPDREDPLVAAQLEMVTEVDGHEGPVRTLRFLPQQQTTISIDARGNVLWTDARTGKVADNWDEVGYVSDAHISADGRRLAVSVNTAREESYIDVWDIDKRNRIQHIVHDLEWCAPVLSPDGSQVLAVGKPAVAVLWNVGQKAPVKRFTYESGERDDIIKKARFSPDGRTIALARVGKLRLVDVTTGRMLHDIVLPDRRSVRDVRFSLDGTHVAIGQNGGHLTIIDVGTGELVPLKSEGLDESLMSCLFHSGGKHLVTVTYNGTIRVHRLLDGRVIARARTKEGTSHCASLSADGRYLVTAGGLTWNKQTTHHESNGDYALRLWRLPESVWPKPKGKRRAEARQPLEDWRPKRGGDVQPPATLKSLGALRGHTSIPSDVAFSSDARRLLSAGRSDFTVRMWDVAERKVLKVYGVERARKAEPISVEWIGRNRFASGHADGTIRVWNAESGKVLHHFKAHRDEVAGLGVGKTGTASSLISRSARDFVRFFRTDGYERARIPTDETDGAMDVTADGKYVAVTSLGGKVQVYASINREAAFKDGARLPVAVAIADDGSVVAAGGIDGDIHVYDLRAERKIAAFRAHDTQVDSLDFTPDGKLLISGGEDGRLRVWRVADKGLVAEARHPNLKGRNVAVPFLNVAVAADGRTVATTTRNRLKEESNTIRLWRLPESKFGPNRSRRFDQPQKTEGSGNERDRAPATIAGLVALDDQPVSNATVTLHFLNGSGTRSTVTKDDGTFNFEAPTGKAKIIVKKQKHLPAKYGTPETTPLSVQIKSGENELTLKLGTR